MSEEISSTENVLKVDSVLIFNQKAFEEYCEIEDAEFEEMMELQEMGY